MPADWGKSDYRKKRGWETQTLDRVRFRESWDAMESGLCGYAGPRNVTCLRRRGHDGPCWAVKDGAKVEWEAADAAQ